jgi:hypothetical protein
MHGGDDGVLLLITWWSGGTVRSTSAVSVRFGRRRVSDQRQMSNHSQ